MGKGPFQGKIKAPGNQQELYPWKEPSLVAVVPHFWASLVRGFIYPHPPKCCGIWTL